MILFKSIAVKDGFRKLNPLLQTVAYAQAGYMQFHFGLDLFITSTIRDSSEVHERGDGYDYRDNMLDAQGDELLAWTNAGFDYGDGFKTVIDERKKPKGSKTWTGPHFHTQSNWRHLGEAWL